MNVTIKSDWMNNYLSQIGCLVSSHKSINTNLELPLEYDISIRFIGNAKIGYSYFFIIITEGLPENCINYIEDNKALRSLLNRLAMKFTSKIHLIICGEEEEVISFAIPDDDGEFLTYSEMGLVDYFATIDQEFVINSGANKKINKTTNDIFQVWTRKHLSKYITANDFDALFIKDNFFYIFELKRIDSAYNTLLSWRPYCADFGNYRACDLIRKKCNLLPNCFRVITYMADNKKEISVFSFTDISKNAQSDVQYQGKFDMVEPQMLFQELPQTFIGCKR